MDAERLSEQLRVLSETTSAFAAATIDPVRLFDDVVTKIAQAVGGSCSLSTLSEDGLRIEPVAVHYPEPENQARAQVAFRTEAITVADHPITQRALDTGEGTLVAHLDIETMRPPRTTQVYYELLRDVGVHSMLLVPLRAYGRAIGTLFVTRHGTRSRAFDTLDQVFVQSLADHAALAISNARAYAAERRANAALAEGRRVFFEQNPVPMFVGNRDEGRFMAVNQAALSLYGYEEQEFLGMDIAALVPAEERPTVTARIKTLFADPVDRLGTTRHLRKDGTFAELDYVSRPTTFDGHPAFVSVLRDRSDQLRAQDAQDHLAAVVAASDDAMVMAAPDGTVLTWNNGAERMYGYTAGQMIGQNIFELAPPERRHEGPEIFERVNRGERIGHFETVRVHRDGHLLDVSVSISSIRAANGGLRALLSVSRDISEQKQLEERRRALETMEVTAKNAQETNHLKTEFLANMSHELRTPLNAVIGFTTLLRAGKVGVVSDEQREYLGDILSSSQHLLKIINDVLDVARVEAGRLELRPRRVALVKVVREFEETMRLMAAERNLRTEATLEPGLGTVVTDVAALKQIIFNFLSNAVKFTPDSGTITLRLGAVDDATFRIDVEDTGIGVRPEDIKKLFVEFQQLDASARKRYPGTGLGLALTKRLVEAQGGRVEVQTTFGAGSRFSAILPRRLAPRL